MRIKTSRKKKYELAVAIGLALSLGGASLSAEAAVQTSPMQVTEKDKVIDDDFNVKGHTYATAIYVAPSSTGTVQVNSNTVHVENVGQAKEDTGVIDTGYGWSGTLNLKSGMQISGDFSGTAVWARGIQLNGLQKFSVTNDTGNPYAGTAYLGDNVSVSLTGNNATESAGLYGIEVDGENLQAGNGLTSTVSAHTGSFATSNSDSGAELFGLQLIHYGTVQIGDHATIKVYNQIEKDSPHILSDGVQTVHNWAHEKVDTPAKGRQKLTIGKEAVISSEAYNDKNFKVDGGEVEGIRLSHTDFSLGDGAQITTKTTGVIPFEVGIYTDYHTQAVIGKNMTDTVSAEGQVPFVMGIEAKNSKNQGEVDENLTNTLTIGSNGKTIVSYQGDGENNTRGIDIEGGQVILNDDNTLQVSGKNTHTHGNNAYTMGVRVTEAGQLEAGNGLQSIVHAENNERAYGLEQKEGSSTSIGNRFRNTLQASDTNEVEGVYSVNSKMTVGDDSLNEVQAKGEAPYFWITGYDIDGKTTDGSLNLKLGNRARTDVSYEGNTSSNLQLCGIYNINAISQIGDDASISASAPVLTDSHVFGLLNNKGQMTIGKNVTIQVRSLGGKRGYGIYNLYGTTELGDGASVLLDTAATQNAAVFTVAKGNVIFDGGMKVQTGADQDALSAKAEGTIAALGEGTKQIYGNLLSAGGGTINLKLATADSLLRGKSAVESAKNLSGVLTAGQTNLTLANGAQWDMTGDSTVTTLDHENSGVVNMAYNSDYQTLNAVNYQGQNGIFRMKTDLGQDNKSGVGDKVYIDSAAAGASGKIQVHDESFLTGHEVTGTKHELLITDNSKNAAFTGMTLDEGGLWDVTPTIQNGKYVREVMGDQNAQDTEWYLTKLTRSINKDTLPMLKNADNDYALYRDSIDTLRQRLGELRFWQKASQAQKDDNSGIWARDTYSSYAGNGLESKENRFQLGFDHWSDRKSVYGLFGERGIANPHYAYGAGKNHSIAGAAYGTWFGDNGSYTDVVAKAGRHDVNLHTFGSYPDKADYRTWERSFSAEYGRTHTLNAHGLFLEPQAQMVFGHMDGENYTTSRGKTMHMDSFNSRIGRLGFVFGKRRPEAARPFDYYLKASILHEFGGDRDFYLTAPDGETMSVAGHYRDTWYELGFGGTYHMNDRTYLYADASRTYGGTWNQKWRWNAGMQWAF